MRDTMRNNRGPAARREPDFDDLFTAAKRRRKARQGGLLQRIGGRRIADILAASVAVAAALLVFVNALSMQRAPHQGPVPAQTSTETATKRATPPAPATTAPIPPTRPDTGNRRTRSDMMLDVQRELASRGYYDGAVDGQTGPRISQAIRGFEQTNGLKATGEPSDTLLEKIRKASAKSDITGSIQPTSKVTSGSRIVSVQSALARYGYGPVRLNGEMDKDTRAAVERFERDRNLPATGEVSDRLVRELAAFSGASLD